MEWHYLLNQFDNATIGSFRLMLTITNDHYAKLQAQQADPDILILLNRTDPVHQAFLDQWSTWKSSEGIYRGATDATEALLNQLSSTFARQWDTAIMGQFDLGTTEHTTLLPDGRTPFQQGTTDERVAAVKTLGLTLADFAPLAPLKLTVDGFHTTLKNARDGQQAKEQLADQARNDMETARKAIAVMQFRNLGSLMDKFGETPSNVANYFEVSLLQRKAGSTPPKEEEFIGTVGPMSTVNITSGIAAEASIILTNTGSVMLRFCAAPDATTACMMDGIDLLPGAVIEAKGSDLDNPANTFINVTNNDPMTEGSYNMEVITPV
jgi:hypothetical protein